MYIRSFGTTYVTAIKIKFDIFHLRESKQSLDFYISYCYSNSDHDRQMVYIIKKQKTSSFSATMINSNDDHISMLEIWHSC